jgi:hypothetical protein
VKWKDEILAYRNTARVYTLRVKAVEQRITDLCPRVNRDHIQFDITLDHNVALDERRHWRWECQLYLCAVDFERQIWTQNPGPLIYRDRWVLAERRSHDNLPAKMSVVTLVRVVDVDGGPVLTWSNRCRSRSSTS